MCHDATCFKTNMKTRNTLNALEFLEIEVKLNEHTLPASRSQSCVIYVHPAPRFIVKFIRTSYFPLDKDIIREMWVKGDLKDRLGISHRRSRMNEEKAGRIFDVVIDFKKDAIGPTLEKPDVELAQDECEVESKTSCKVVMPVTMRQLLSGRWLPPKLNCHLSSPPTAQLDRDYRTLCDWSFTPSVWRA
ncbi:hypothetical protein K474DRAFT_1680362 [Panus rudis PR-1116 ss-1]|nr:hypothetical protein K474DRAFT_1680362 [Panus rudis PR-1116 ss-1]